MRRRDGWQCVFLGVVLLAGVFPASAQLPDSPMLGSPSHLVPPADVDSLDLTAELLQVALFDTRSGEWHLMNSDGSVESFYYGLPGDLPLMGDWDCDGVDTVGMFRPSNGFVYLRNANTFGVADTDFFYGIGGDVPLAGDFDGDGCDTLAIYRPSEGRVYVSNRLGTYAADFDFYFGMPGDRPFAGDFNGDGITTVGLYRDTAGYVYFRDSLTTGVADYEFYYGVPSDRIVAGDWDCDGDETVGIFRPSDMSLYLSNQNALRPADLVLTLHGFNHGDLVPVAGDYRGHQSIEPPELSRLIIDDVTGSSRGHSITFAEADHGFERMDFFGGDLIADIPPEFAVLTHQDTEQATYFEFNDDGRLSRMELAIGGTMTVSYGPEFVTLTMTTPDGAIRSIEVPIAVASDAEQGIAQPWFTNLDATGAVVPPAVNRSFDASSVPGAILNGKAGDGELDQFAARPAVGEPYYLFTTKTVEARASGEELPFDLTPYFRATPEDCTSGTDEYGLGCHAARAGQFGEAVRFVVLHRLELTDVEVQELTPDECEELNRRIGVYNEVAVSVVIFGVAAGALLFWLPGAIATTTAGQAVAAGAIAGLANLTGMLVTRGANYLLTVDCSDAERIWVLEQRTLPTLDLEVVVATLRPPGYRWSPATARTDQYTPFPASTDTLGVDFTLEKTEGTVRGRVEDLATGTPVLGAKVSLEWILTTDFIGKEALRHGWTTADGFLFEEVPEGEFVVRVTKDGYDDSTAIITVTADQGTVENFTLRPKTTGPPPRSFTIRLRWEGSFSELDLHTFGPDVENDSDRFHAWYDSPRPVTYIDFMVWDDLMSLGQRGTDGFVPGFYQVSLENVGAGYWGVTQPFAGAEATIDVISNPISGLGTVVYTHPIPTDPGYNDLTKTHWVVFDLEIMSDEGAFQIHPIDDFFEGSPSDRHAE